LRNRLNDDRRDDFNSSTIGSIMIRALLWLSMLSQTPSAEPPMPREALAQLQAGVNAEKQRDLESAIADFRKATELAPASSLPFLRLGNAYMTKRDYAQAIPPLKRAVELNPASAPAHQLLGFALLAQGYAAGAIPHLDFVHEYGALGIAQLQNGQPAEAVSNLQAALAKNPRDPDLLYYLSRAGTALSAQSLDKLLSTAPNSARGHQAAGQNYFDIKMFPEAKKEYMQALALRPDLPGLRLELGQVYSANSEWDKAEEQFREETKLQPGNAEAAYRLGDALLQQGKMKEALEQLKRSDSLHPDMPETLYALGRAAAVSEPTDAEHALLRVIELEKETPLAGQAYYALAGIHRKQGKSAQATKEMQEYSRIQALNNHGSTGP
jgi:tetratricopeptide (TPR) repeat protein